MGAGLWTGSAACSEAVADDRAHKLGAKIPWGFLALGAVIVVAFFVHLRPWRFICDDAYISFRYARNLAESGQLAYNLHPLEKVEGYTNFAWVLVLALGEWVGVASPKLAPVLTATACVACLLLSAELMWELRTRFFPVKREWAAKGEHAGRRLSDWVPAALLVGVPEFVVWGSSGLETSAAAALVLGAFVTFVRQRLTLAAALSALAGLTRPDALLPIALFGLAWIGVSVTRASGDVRGLLRRIDWTAVAVAFGTFAIPLMLHATWRHHYYGEWWPNTWFIKRHGMLLVEEFGKPYAAGWVENLHLVYLAPLLLLARPRHILLAAPAGAIVYYVTSVGGDFMAYSRFLLVPTICVAVLAGWLLVELEVLVRDKLGRRDKLLPIALGLGLVLAGIGASGAKRRIALDVSQGSKWIDDRFEGVTAMERFATERVKAGAWMAENLDPSTLVTVGAAGAMPYASGVQVIDAYGLVTPWVADVAEPKVERGRPGHQLYAPISAVQQHDPDLYCHIGWVGRRTPKVNHARRRIRGNYRWACIPVGTVADPRTEEGERNVGHYCCIRHADDDVGPFYGSGKNPKPDGNRGERGLEEAK